MTTPIDLAPLETKLLFRLEARVGGSYDGGDGPLGRRLMDATAGGSFRGPRLSGELIAGTGDWRLIRRDGTSIIDARVVLKTDDGHIIHMRYEGRAVVPVELLGMIRDPERAHEVDPSRYYIRTAPTFETGAPAYAWLNNVIAVGKGQILRGRSLAYDVYEVL
jgi:hypothetical protein